MAHTKEIVIDYTKPNKAFFLLFKSIKKTDELYLQEIAKKKEGYNLGPILDDIAFYRKSLFYCLKAIDETFCEDDGFVDMQLNQHTNQLIVKKTNINK